MWDYRDRTFPIISVYPKSKYMILHRQCLGAGRVRVLAVPYVYKYTPEIGLMLGSVTAR